MYTGLNQSYIAVQIGSEKSHALLDTGASISCISAEFFSKLETSALDISTSPGIMQIQGIGGEVHKVSKQATLPLSIAEHSCPQSFYVVPGIHPALVLGTDFCQKYKIEISFSEKRVKIQEDQAAVRLITPASCVGLGRTTTTTTIPAKAQADIHVRVSRECNGLVMFLEPTRDLLTNHHLLGARCIVNPEESKTQCRILNITNQDIVIPAGLIVAKATSVLPSDVTVPTELSDNGDSSPPPMSEQEAKNLFLELNINLDMADLSPYEKQELLIFLGRNRDIFAINLSELSTGNTDKHYIDTTNAPPQKQRFYRQSPEMRAETKRQIDDMLTYGIIEPSTSPWQAPVVLVKKKSGEFRFAVDFRKINAVTRKEHFPLTRIEDVFDAVGQAKASYFSTLDLASGFWQIPLDPRTKHKTAFTTCHGNYEFNRLPFGLCNAPSSYQSIMTSVLNQLNFRIALVYIDDVIIFSRTFKEHLQHLHLVFQRLRKANLKLKPSKCNFACPEVLYLGHIITKDGVRVDPRKTQAVNDYPRPRTPKELRGFLGLCNYYRRFVLGYSTITAPLTRLLKNDVKFEWSDGCEQAFQTLKAKLVSAPILAYPDMTKDFILTTDASMTAIGYILSQKIEDKEHPIAFGGRATRKSEKNYSITDLECLAVLEGIRANRPYLADRHFHVYTDHLALTSLMKMKDPKGRAARWSLALQGLDFTIHYKPGIKNKNADAMSRREYPDQTDSADDDDDLPHIFQITVQNSPCKIDMWDQPPEPAKVDLEYDDDPVIQNTVFAINPTVDMKTLQARCPVLNPMIQYLESGDLPENKIKAKNLIHEASQYVIDDTGVLYHLYEPRGKRQNRLVRQLAVPMSMRNQIMHEHHDALIGGGHQGFDRTYSLIRQKYYWPRMFAELQAYIKSCDACQKAKGPHHKTNPPLTPLPIASKFHRWHMDILELSKCDDGYRYVLLMVDSMTRWMEAIPLKSQEATEVASVIYRDLICRYGAPRTLVSDLGKSFLARVVQALCKLFQIKRHHTSAYHPQSNSTCERVNRTLGQALRAYCNKQNEWVDKLPGILMALRRTPSDRSTKHSPFLLTFGQEMQAPVDTALLPADMPDKSTKDYLSRLTALLAEAETLATQNCESAQQQYKKDYDQKAKLPKFKVGDLVTLFTPKVPKGLSRKLYKKYDGPYVVTGEGPNFTYSLSHCDKDKTIQYANAGRLSPYADPRDRYKHTPDPDNQPLTDETQNVPTIDKQTQGDSNEPTPSTQPTDTPQWYSVQKILGRRRQKGRTLYRIKWEGYKETTWEPEANLSPALLRQYKVDRAKKKRFRSRP